MLAQFKDHVLKNLGLDPQGLYLVAVSGGKDSVALLDLLKKQGFNLHVAHCNFGLRAGESDEDELFVRQLADSYAIPISVKDFRKEERLAQANTQITARELRYSWFEALRKEFGAIGVFVGHHLNDSVETNIYNLIKGTGPAGLSPMKSIQGNIIRPLLPFKREEIDDFVNQEGLGWRDDSSNDSTKYSRNKIRHQIIHGFQEINPSVVDTIGRNAVRHEQYALVIKKLAEDLKEETTTGFRVAITSVPKVGGAAVLYELFNGFGLNWSQSEQLMTALDAQESKTFYLTGYVLFVDREFLVLKREQEGADTMSFDNMEELRASNLFSLRSISKKEIIRTTDLATIDSSKLKWPLTWRGWKIGDYIRPIGMAGKKQLVSDTFTNAKVDASAKQDLYVLAMAGEVIWIPSVKFSESVKVSEETTEIIELRLQ